MDIGSVADTCHHWVRSGKLPGFEPVTRSVTTNWRAQNYDLERIFIGENYYGYFIQVSSARFIVSVNAEH